jgi:hypothetical protein
MINGNVGQGFDPADVEKLKEQLEFALDGAQPTVMPTRASVKRQFSYLDEDSMLEIQAAMDKLGEKLGSTNITVRYLHTDEIDSLIEELLAVRKMNDIVSAREDTLKTFAKNVISLDQPDPDRTSGSLVSNKHNIKISKEIRGGKLSVDIDLLRKRLTGEQFSSVVNVITTTVETVTPDGKMDEVITTTYEINDEFLESEMVKGNILSEDVFLSTVESKRTTAIYIREIGDL